MQMQKKSWSKDVRLENALSRSLEGGFSIVISAATVISRYNWGGPKIPYLFRLRISP